MRFIFIFFLVEIESPIYFLKHTNSIFCVVVVEIEKKKFEVQARKSAEYKQYSSNLKLITKESIELHKKNDLKYLFFLLAYFY